MKKKQTKVHKTALASFLLNFPENNKFQEVPEFINSSSQSGIIDVSQIFLARKDQGILVIKQADFYDVVTEQLIYHCISNQIPIIEVEIFSNKYIFINDKNEDFNQFIIDISQQYIPYLVNTVYK